MKDPILSVLPSVEELLNSLANFLVDIANKTIREKGEFTFVLSGGNSPKKLYKLLASSAYRNKIDWTKVFFFFGDERYVPFDDPENNALMAKETLFDPLQIPKLNVFSINTSFLPEKSAQNYLDMLDLHFQGKPMQFDLILLGLGDNVHTASLFPYTAVLSEEKALVKAVFINELNAYRITFTAPLINKANNIVFLVYGKDKAEAVKHVFGEVHDIEKYPAQLIHSNRGTVHWFLDEKAAFFLH